MLKYILDNHAIAVMLLCRLNQTLLHRAIANLALLFLMEIMYLFRSGHLRK